MKKISRTQQAEINKAVDALGEAGKALAQAIDSYNEALEPLRVDIEAARDTYNEKIADLKAVYVDIAGEARAYYDDRSQKWQEGEAGEAYSEWVDQLDEPQIEEIDLDLPEPLEMPDSTPDFEDDSWLPPAEPGDA